MAPLGMLCGAVAAALTPFGSLLGPHLAIWLHFCSRSGLFFIKKIQVFKYQNGSKMDPKTTSA